MPQFLLRGFYTSEVSHETQLFTSRPIEIGDYLLNALTDGKTPTVLHGIGVSPGYYAFITTSHSVYVAKFMHETKATWHVQAFLSPVMSAHLHGAQVVL